MAHLLFFSCPDDFKHALDSLSSSRRYREVLTPPKFCLGFIPPAILVSGERNELQEELQQYGISFSGLVPHQIRTTKHIDGDPPKQIWKQILGQMKLRSVCESVSDSTRLHIEVQTEKSFGDLIPYMAALIRGGTYNPRSASMALDEGHRLIAFCNDTVFISRCDDIHDFWFQLRCSVDLICDAFEKKSFIKPVSDSRQGIGAVEIFRRLPATNCGKCGFATCMEFSVALFTGRAIPDLCKPIFKHDNDLRRESLLWLLSILGVG